MAYARRTSQALHKHYAEARGSVSREEAPRRGGALRGLAFAIILAAPFWIAVVLYVVLHR